MTLAVWAAFAGFSACGAVLRYVVGVSVQGWLSRAFPWGTLVVNAVGSLLLGLLAGLWRHHGLPDEVMIVLGAGLCGSYTTFSTFGVETVQLLETGPSAAAVRNVTGTVLACGVAAVAGYGVTVL